MFRQFISLDGRAQLYSIGVTLPLAEVYAGAF